MAIYSTSTGLQALIVSVRANFQKGYNSDAYTPVAPRIASVGSTRSRKTRFPFPIDSAAIRRHVGDRVFNVVKATSQDLDAAPYELSYVVDRDDLSDEDQSENAVAMLGTTIRRAGRKYRILPDRLLRDVLSANANSVVDGRPLFGTHYVDPTDTGSTAFSNTAIATLTPDNLWAAVAAMGALTGPDGDPVNPSPKQLLVPLAQEKNALECTQAMMVPNAGGGASQDNVLARMGFSIVVWPMLDALSTTTWYLQDVSDPEDRGLVYLERQAPEIVENFDPTSETAQNENQYEWKSRARGVAGGGNPMKIRRHTAS